MGKILDETRRAVLDAGVTILHEQGPQAGVAHVKLATAATRAGYTTGAVYRCWDNQAAFHRELAIAATEHHEKSVIDNLVRAVRRAVETRAPLAEVIRVGTGDNVRSHRSAEAVAALALRASGAGDPDVRQACAQRFSDGIDEHGRLYEVILRSARRRIRAPYTSRDLVLVLGAMGDGFTIQTQLGIDHPQFERDTDDAGVGDDWTLFGVAVEAVVDHLTEPIPLPAGTEL